MNITHEAILSRKAELEKELEDTLSKANAISGAIQDCEHWLAFEEKQGGDDLPAPVPGGQEKATTEA